MPDSSTSAPTSTRNPPPPPVEPIFDRTPSPFGDALAEPMIQDASVQALRQRTVNFAAKRYADMMFVSGLDRATADEHFRWRPLTIPAGLRARLPAGVGREAIAAAGNAEQAHAEGQIVIDTHNIARRVRVRWDDPALGVVTGTALGRSGYGGILLGEHDAPRFDPYPVARRLPDAALAWPVGQAVAAPPAPSGAMAAALDAFFASSSGLYAVVVTSPDRVLAERYSAFGRPDRPTPSWSMTKAVTATLIGRLIHEGWLQSVHDPVPAPLWRDPRGIHRLITIDHLLRMRGGLGFPVQHEDGTVTLGFENSSVYQDGRDSFEAAQRSIVATVPGAVFRYINSGMNVLGATIRDQIERRGLPYHRTVYALLADRLGMHSYQHSADIAGNFIASGAGFATARDYAKLGVLYLNEGLWNGEQLLPPGWADYALTATHTGTSYAACFRTNTDRLFPDLPEDAAWASGASDQRIFILRRARLTVTVTNETDHKVDLAALNRLVATAIDTYA